MLARDDDICRMEHTIVHYLHLVTMGVAIAFAIVLFRHRTRKPEAKYLMWWTFGVAVHSRREPDNWVRVERARVLARDSDLGWVSDHRHRPWTVDSLGPAARDRHLTQIGLAADRS